MSLCNQLPWSIGTIDLSGRVLAAPMAGVSDRIFRTLARHHGATLAPSEMVATEPQLRGSQKTCQRMNHLGEPGPSSIQLLGANPRYMAAAARYSVDQGAQLIDINMGCPAKKVCKKLVGSALMRNEHLIGEILDAVVSAVPVPVTLKMRTGWEPGQRNAVRIARLAESAGIQAITIHGRTRQCKYRGPVEYDTIRAVKRAVAVPVIANGDIDSPQKARAVLAYTGADAVMIGRAAQGNPWLFGRIDRYLREGRDPGEPLESEKRQTLIQHLEHLYRFYGTQDGVRIARKHFSWYVSAQGGDERSRRLFCAAADPVPQLRIARSIQFAPRYRDVKSDEKMAQTAVSIG